MTPSTPSDPTASPSPGPRAPADRSARRMPLALATVSLVGVVLVLVAVLFAVKVTHGSTGSGPPPTPLAPAALVTQATTVPAGVLDVVGAPGPPLVTPPARLAHAQPLRSGGRALVVYVGAEYCPFCAAERWALVVALSRFGTFSHLGLATSSSQLVFPGLQSFSFRGVSYRSPYVAFDAVETYGSDTTASSGDFAPLQPLTGQASTLMQRLDVPPLAPVPSTLPFVDLGGRYVAVGSGFSPGILAGRPMDAIATDLAQATSPVAQAVDGTANELTAAICSSTGQQPASVCGSPAAQDGRLRTR